MDWSDFRQSANVEDRRRMGHHGQRSRGKGVAPEAVPPQYKRDPRKAGTYVDMQDALETALPQLLQPDLAQTPQLDSYWRGVPRIGEFSWFDPLPSEDQGRQLQEPSWMMPLPRPRPPGV